MADPWDQFGTTRCRGDTADSQRLGPGSIPALGTCVCVCVARSLFDLPVSALVSSGGSGFLPQYKDVVRWIDHVKLSLSVQRRLG